ncbi:MAG: hypothetical protein JSW00_10690 [Thermoplasmata archaeon]|nr:MAG: hypothetical protein JSW00_10690 [Thermoplasmata archaeon]
MKKIDMVYAEIMKRQVVNTDDLDEIMFSVFGKPLQYKYFYNQYLSKLVKENKLVRIRRGLYHGIDIYSTRKSKPDKYLISAKLRKHYYLGYHTALELHGCAYSDFNRCYIVTTPNSKFEPFYYDNLNFQKVFTRDIESFIETIKYSGQSICVSNPSRTFVECINRPEFCGGWEEVLKSLDSLGNVKIHEVQKILKIYDKQILYRKCGYVLDIMIKNSPYYKHIEKQKGLHPIGKSAPDLFIKKNNRGKYIPKWKLFAPFDFAELIREV